MSPFIALLTLQGQTAVPTTRPAALIRPAADPKSVSLKLKLEPERLNFEFNRANRLGYYPSSVKLDSAKPLGLVKEPAYVGTPLYGAIRLGNGPRSFVLIAIDEKDDQTRIYVDSNGNGDLTDDGGPDWTTRTEKDGLVNLQREAVVRVSYGDASEEVESADYSLLLYRRKGDPRLNYTRTAARTGKLTLGDRSYDVLLADNQNDALFTVPRKGDSTRRPVWLLIDEEGKGEYRRIDLSEPFKIGDATYEAFPSLSGSELNVGPAGAKAAPAVAPRILKKVGETAPDFTVASPDGKPVKLSDFRGKTVILDFWATWCGPCQASMPGLEKIYRQVKSQNVVVLSVNVWDSKAPFDDWIKANSGSKYSFTFGYDSADRDHTKSVASAGYGVSGIPFLVYHRQGREDCRRNHRLG